MNTYMVRHDSEKVEIFQNVSLRWILAFCITLVLIFQPEYGIPQSLTGTTGLLTIPTAEMPKYGELSFGMNWLNKKYLYYSRDYYHGIAYFATLGYLPFLEITPRLTTFLNFPRSYGLGDRMVGIKLRPIKENEFLPSIVFGVQDPFGDAQNFTASYVVASKHLHVSHRGAMGLHLGYGTDWLEARNYQFVGVFGGVSFSPVPSLTLMLEHDAEKFNSGLRLVLFERMQFLVALLSLDTLSVGVNYKFKL